MSEPFEIRKNETSTSWIFFAARANVAGPRRSLAERLGEINPVLIVEEAVSAIRRPGAYPLEYRRRPLGAKATEYRPFHTPELIPGLNLPLKFLNRRRLLREVQTMFRGSPTVVCYDSPSQYHLVGQFHEVVAVYFAVDDRTITVTGAPIKGELESEQKLLARADLVVCVSDALAKTLRGRAPSPDQPPVYVLPNGYDERIFDPDRSYPEPQPLRTVSRPRILVSGHISERIDWDGIGAACHVRPEWTWIFIGRTDPGVSEKIVSRLGIRAQYYPAVDVSDIPAWIRHCDACAVPYRLNNFTRASSPLKAIEYLAMGKPVLSTRVPSLDRYGKVIEWVDEGNGESYARALDRCNNTEAYFSGREARRHAVKGDSWAIRASQFRDMVLNGNS